MQEHHYSVDIEASPDELWQLFWARIPHTETGDVTIDILHPGDAIGEGLIRHCTFRVPRYLLTGGKGQSWEWLTEVTPTGLVEVHRRRAPAPSRKPKDGRGWRISGTGPPGCTSPRRTTRSTRSCAALFEKRVHAFISKDNDRLIKESLTKGVGYLRAAKAKAQVKAAGENRRRRCRPRVTIVDLWVNALDRQGRRRLHGPGRE